MTTIQPQPSTTNFFAFLPDACTNLILNEFLGSPRQSLSLRGVCRDWRYHRVRGIAVLQWRLSANNSSRPNVKSLEVKGVLHPQKKRQDDILEPVSTSQLAPIQTLDHPHRAKGHLPPPRVLEAENDAHSPKESWIRERMTCVDTLSSNRLVVRLEVESMGRHWRTIDWTESSFRIARTLGEPRRPGRLSIKIVGFPTKRTLVHVDLSALQYLQRCSFSGCGSLKHLTLPGCLKAVDVSGCTLLKQLQAEGCGLDALNLNGCRSLKRLQFLRKDSSTIKAIPEKPSSSSPKETSPSSSVKESSLATSFSTKEQQPRFFLSLAYIKELDLSSTTQLSIPLVAQSLAMTTRLELISIRYVAQNSWLEALASSKSAQNSLHRIDLSFSSSITDKAVLTLVKSATLLERVNLRGCRGISVGCYNQVPILLRGSLKESKSEATESTLSSSSLKRKGDNIFQLLEGITGARQSKKKAT